jgi:hypothetical protein
MRELLRRAGEWLVEPLDEEPVVAEPPAPVSFPLIGVVGLGRRCGATTVARALAVELGSRASGAAVVTSPERPAVVALGASAAAARLADRLEGLGSVRPAGRLCLARCAGPAAAAAATRSVAPAVVEVEAGAAAVEAAPQVDRVVLVTSPELEPALAAAVAETIAAVAAPPLVVVNRALEHEPTVGDVLLPDSRIGARLALAGREARGELGAAVARLADLCAA